MRTYVAASVTVHAGLSLREFHALCTSSRISTSYVACPTPLHGAPATSFARHLQAGAASSGQQDPRETQMKRRSFLLKASAVAVAGATVAACSKKEEQTPATSAAPS